MIHSEPSGACSTVRIRPKSLVEVADLAAGVGPAEPHGVQRLPAQRADPGPPAGDGEAAGRAGRRRAPGDERVGVAARARRRPRRPASRSCRPATIRLSSSRVFCPNSVAHIRPLRVPGQPLHVAVAVGPHRGCRTGCRPAPPPSGSSRRILPPSESRVLGAARAVARVAGADVEHAVGAEREPAAVVVDARAGSRRGSASGRDRARRRRTSCARSGCRRRR